MGLRTMLKAGKALRLQRNGNPEQALPLYEEAFSEGLNDARFILPYSLLLIRDGQYQKAKEFLVARQNAPGMVGDQRVDLLVYYATCCFRLGNLDKGISTLEQQFRKAEKGLIFQTLGYLYIEKYDQANRPDFAALAEAAAREEAPAPEENGNGPENEDAEGEAPEDAEPEVPALSPEEEWNAGIEKAEAFIRKSVEYDDEDPICLDNLGEFLYRVRGDREAAREWFDKAIALKENQIDTLYFLSRYDLEAGNREAALAKLEKAAGGRFSPLNYCSREKILQEIDKLKGAL